MGKLFVIFMLVLTLCSCSNNFEHGAGEAQNGEQTAEKTISQAEIAEHFSTEGIVIIGAEKYSSVPGTETEIYLFENGEERFLTDNGYRSGKHSVIIRNSKGQHYVVKSFEDFRDFDAGITHITGDYYCLTAGKEICFFDAEKGAKLDFTLDFEKPENDYYALCSVAYDEETKTYVLIYAPDYGAEDAKIAFQRFDAEGNYIDTTETDIPLEPWNGVPSCTPNSYINGKLQFFRRGNKAWFCYDFESGEYLSEEANRAFILGETAVLRYSEGTNDFTYSLFENGERISSLSLYEPDDFYTNGDGKTRLDKQFFDTEEKTLELHFGRAIHKIDFKNETAELSYDFSGLNEKDVLTKSPDGKYEVYVMGTYGRAEELSTLAVKETESGEFRFLGEYTVWKVFTFVDEHTILYDTGFNSIDSLDIVSGENKNIIAFSNFYYGGYDYINEKVCCEFTADTENKLIIGAFVEITSADDEGNLLAKPKDGMKNYYDGGGKLFFAAGHIFFEIYDFDGEYLYTVETEAYADSYRGPTMYEITLDGSGNAVFDSAGGEMQTVKYIKG
ncbi:MAG: hypothetical protein IJ306_04455 [Oscillospiraceae bacterium]|nr:hypothetical protein [Oscillospiraceae bacterium]